VFELAESDASRFAEMVLGAIHREYPNKILHALDSDADVRPPRELTPAFYGCYDWHSAVHGHWSLLRLMRLYPTAAFVEAGRRAVERSLTPENISGELAYLSATSRASFELPYGMAWVTALDSELRLWTDEAAQRWRAAIQPLVALAAERLTRWAERLPRPVRTGEHGQSAFSLSLFWDWAAATDQPSLVEALRARVLALYADDRDGPLHLEPSGFDFLSPCLGEADLLRRALPEDDFGAWLTRFLPHLPRRPDASFLPPVECPDASDGRMAHLDGLNLSRAWMLAGIADALPERDGRRSVLGESAEHHARAGLAAVTGEHYAGSHWQATFAIHLLTRQGGSR
jgi:hypothetical protein